jgi:hypothetical protein
MSRICAVLALALCTGCSAHAEPSTKPSTTQEVLAPQVAGWQAVTDFAGRYPGKNLSITKNSIEFSVAGRFHLHYIGPYGKGRLFKITGTKIPAGNSKNLICPSELSYLAITPGEIKIIHEPTLSFTAFDGNQVPNWQDRNANNASNDCGEFTYGAPLQQ